MVQLHSDKNFHYEGIRAIALTRYLGGDIAEILDVLDRIKGDDFESWYLEWKDLADRLLSTIDESKPDSYSPITLRDVYLRASRYYFVADFFLHGRPDDPRLLQNYKTWRSLFDKGNKYCAIPGIHVTIPTPYSFSPKALIYKASGASASNPRPTLIAGGGFDSNIEELYHVFAIPALERDYNIIIYEGPGHIGLLHEQQQPFTHEWEKVVTPIVDYLIDHNKTDLAYMDTSKLGLIGYSLGGYLAERAAAFEPRLAACIAIDGVWSFADSLAAQFSSVPRTHGKAVDVKDYFDVFSAINEKSSTGDRWYHDQLLFTMRTRDVAKALDNLSKYTIADVAHQIKMPLFVGDASRDIFFLGQPSRVAEAVGKNATLWAFDDKQSAGAHCQSGALLYLNQSLLEWFSKVVGK